MDHLITRETPDQRCFRCGDWTRHVWKLLPLCVPCRKENKHMTPNEYQELALRTEKTPRVLIKQFAYFDAEGHEVEATDPAVATKIDLDVLLHAFMGVTTEIGENTDVLKKSLMYGKSIDRINVLEEFGDKLWYVAIGLKAAGFTIEEAMERNIAKLRKRYPGGFSEDKAINRDLDAERKVLED